MQKLASYINANPNFISQFILDANVKVGTTCQFEFINKEPGKGRL